MRLVWALGLFLTLLHLSTSLLLGAFNIQSFGITKASKPEVMEIITEIVHRYDIILIQEVRDTTLSATKKLMDYVNKDSPQFGYIYSEWMGNIHYNERYLFLYRENMVSVVDSYTYNDTNRNFSRKPFVVKFKSEQTAVKNFVLIPQHTCPEKAVKEINALVDVVDDVVTRWSTKDIVLLGDFNAGCSYVSGDDWHDIRLFTENMKFNWLITDEVDTTVSHSNCPYDRIVVTTDMMRGVVDDSAKVFDYMKAFDLSQKQAEAVSDHFPVEVKLIPAAA